MPMPVSIGPGLTALTVAAHVRGGRCCCGQVRLRDVPEPVEAHCEEIPIRLQRVLLRHEDPRTLRRLQHIKHRPVFVAEQLRRYVDVVVRRDPHEVLVVGAVMNAAETAAVADRRLATLRVRDDVRGIE